MRAAVWIVLAACCAAGARNCGNVALRGKATQSSTSSGGVADRAIDGNRNPYYFNHSCTHTKSESHPWWSIDLFQEEYVLVVKITNRADCCWDRFQNAVVRVGTSPYLRNKNCVCGMISQLGCGETAVLNCKGMLGQFVSVTLSGVGILTMCEVEVYVVS
ncbi:fucolectin-6-like [Pristis pectinata]|uniref:fucolectin-6-like n=1 Tax=Pristis pectinata TaxID=685728 RepID=UPI00223D944F|nr:fucolectin-6-like [Pristis pectinata]